MASKRLNKLNRQRITQICIDTAFKEKREKLLALRKRTAELVWDELFSRFKDSKIPFFPCRNTSSQKGDTSNFILRVKALISNSHLKKQNRFLIFFIAATITRSTNTGQPENITPKLNYFIGRSEKKLNWRETRSALSSVK